MDKSDDDAKTKITKKLSQIYDNTFYQRPLKKTHLKFS